MVPAVQTAAVKKPTNAHGHASKPLHFAVLDVYSVLPVMQRFCQLISGYGL